MWRFLCKLMRAAELRKSPKNPPILLFKDRLYIERLYNRWIECTGVANSPSSVVAFMSINGWLNEQKIIKDLNERSQHSE